MGRTRRTKLDMENMRHECSFYLLQTKLNPHEAYDRMVKEYLTTGRQIPHYIKGMEDFIKVSQELAVELKKKEYMNNKNRQRHEERQDIVNYIMGLSVHDMRDIWKEYKNKVSEAQKLILVDYYTMKHQESLGDKYFKENMIEENEIMLFRSIRNNRQG